MGMPKDDVYPAGEFFSSQQCVYVRPLASFRARTK